MLTGIFFFEFRDEVLTSAEDWQLIGAVVAISTVAAVAIVATGGAIMQVGAAAGGALAGAVGASSSGLVAAGTTAFVTGALGSAAFSASSQFVLTGEVNLLQVATDGLQGGAMALLFVGAAGSLGAAGKWLNKLRNVGDEACNIGTFIATWSMRAYATHGVYSSYQAAQQGDLEAAMSGLGALVGGLKGVSNLKFCFVGDTPVVLREADELPAEMPVADSETEEAGAGWYLAGAGFGAAAALVWYLNRRSEWKRAEQQAHAARDDYFSTGVLDDLWSSPPDCSAPPPRWKLDSPAPLDSPQQSTRV